MEEQFIDDPEARGPLAQFFWVKFRPSDFDASIAGYQGGGIPAEVRDNVVSGYKNYKLNLPEILQKYRLDYVLFTDYEKNIGTVNFSKIKYLEPVFKKGNVTLYRLNI